MWHTVSAFPNCPRPAVLATLSRACSLPKVLGSNRIRRTTSSPPFPTLSWYLKAPRVTGTMHSSEAAGEARLPLWQLHPGPIMKTAFERTKDNKLLLCAQ